MKLILFIISIFSTSLLNYDFNLNLSILPSSIISIVLSYLLINTYKKNKKFNKCIFINSLLFAIFFTIGICYEKAGSLSYFLNFTNAFLCLYNVILFTYLFYIAITYLYSLIDNHKESKKINKVLKFIFYDHPYLTSFAIVLLSSIIYLIFYYPGILAWDGMWQLNYYYKIYGNITNHHPAGLSLIMGHIIDLGHKILNDNFGLFIYVSIQSIINALIYAYVLKIMNKLNTPLHIRIISLIFYAFFPYLVVYSITFIKDTIFYLFILLLFVYTYYHFYIDYNKKNIKKYFFLAFIYIILFIFRNNGFHIILLNSIVMFIYHIKSNKQISIGFLCLLVLSLFLNYTYHNIFMPKNNIKEGSIGEALSIPLQQTARYIKYHKDDISEKEDKYLTEFFGHEYNNVDEKYDPEVSDKVKAQFIHESPTDEELKNYFKAWFTMAFKHPETYIDATLNNTYGYFYPSKYIFTKNSVITYTLQETTSVNYHNLDFHRNKLSKGRNILKESSEFLKKQPVFSLLYTTAFYILILISSIFNLIYQKRTKEIVYFTPLICVLLICLASPVNGYLRYALPIIVSTPFILAILYNKKSINKKM